MTEIGYYSILISLFLSAYCGLALIIGIKNHRAEVIASAENAAMAVFVFLTLVRDSHDLCSDNEKFSN